MREQFIDGFMAELNGEVPDEYLRKITKEKVENMKVLTDAEKQYILNT